MHKQDDIIGFEALHVSPNKSPATERDNMRKKNPDIVSEKNISKKKLPKAYRELHWEKLDNTAHLFPVIASEQMSNVYRVSVTLQQTVEPKYLQQALNMVLPKFDGFRLRMRHGIFWHYLEENNKPAPRVREETEFPCRHMRPNQNNSYLFRVTYYKYRINLEVFHALADGMGGINFLRELTYQYLRLAHPEITDLTGNGLTGGTTLNREDSFLKNFKRSSPKKYATKKACLINGEKLRPGEFGLMHAYMSISELKNICKGYGVTINEYLVAAYIWSIYSEHLHSMPTGSPIRIAVPVNLRPYFSSITTKNFFVMISAEFQPQREDHTFTEIIETVRESLRNQLKGEHLEKVFSYNVSRQKSAVLKFLPLPFKHIGMRFVFNRSALANTSTLSNIGRIEVDEPYRPYIDTFHAFMAVSKGQYLKGTVCSYEDRLIFTFSYTLKDVSVQRGFLRALTEDGLHVETETNGVHYG